MLECEFSPITNASNLSKLTVQMKKNKRQEIILEEISLHNKVHSVELSELLQVSNDTIRRDIAELDEQGLISKVHGGAISKSFVSPFNSDNITYAAEEKQLIAKRPCLCLKMIWLF